MCCVSSLEDYTLEVSWNEMCVFFIRKAGLRNTLFCIVCTSKSWRKFVIKRWRGVKIWNRGYIQTVLARVCPSECMCVCVWVHVSVCVRRCAYTCDVWAVVCFLTGGEAGGDAENACPRLHSASCMRLLRLRGILSVLVDSLLLRKAPSWRYSSPLSGAEEASAKRRDEARERWHTHWNRLRDVSIVANDEVYYFSGGSAAIDSGDRLALISGCVYACVLCAYVMYRAPVGSKNGGCPLGFLPLRRRAAMKAHRPFVDVVVVVVAVAVHWSRLAS